MQATFPSLILLHAAEAMREAERHLGKRAHPIAKMPLAAALATHGATIAQHTAELAYVATLEARALETQAASWFKSSL